MAIKLLGEHAAGHTENILSLSNHLRGVGRMANGHSNAGRPSNDRPATVARARRRPSDINNLHAMTTHGDYSKILIWNNVMQTKDLAREY